MKSFQYKNHTLTCHTPYPAYLCLFMIGIGGLLSGCQLGVPTRTVPQPPVASQIPPSQTSPSPTQAAVPTQSTEPTSTQMGGGEITPSLNLEQTLAALEGLPLDDFFEQSYKALILRSPQKVTALGLADDYGMGNDQLDDLSDEYQRGTWQLEAAILDLLHGYDRQSLSGEEQINYDVYEWYLDMRVQGQQFGYHNYPLTHFLDSYQFVIEQLFTEYQPLEDQDDYQDYITRLSQVDRQVEQFFEGLKIREQMGIIPPRFIIQLARQDILARLGASTADPALVDPTSLSVYLVFQDKVTRDKQLNDEGKAALLNAAREQIEVSYIPAFIKLLEYLDEIEPKASDEAGVWKLPDGEAYYAWLLRLVTSTDLSPEQVHELGLSEIERIQKELREAVDDLRYPAQLISVNERIEMARNEAGYIQTYQSAGKAEVIHTYESLLEKVERAIQPVFDLGPSTELIIYPDETFGGGGGFYVPGTLDGSRPGAFHTGVGGGYVPRINMPTILFHEGVPGHHFQIAVSYDLDLPTFRNDIVLNGYVEGWALYAEQLAWELGMYEGDPHGNVGRLSFELLRAVRLVVDTGLHSKEWTRQEAQRYMDRILGDFVYEVDRYVVWPAQATSYKIGMLKILELRQLAEDELGEDFNLVDFHHIVLSNGSLPLEMLEKMVKAYIGSAQ
jgi:uncharacterized protein (DUF885 family)